MNESAALNASDNSAEAEDERVNVEKYVVPVVFGLIFVVGAVGNGSLMFIICRYKSMRNLPNIFVFNLALGDLFILLFAVPFTSSIYTFDLWPFGELVCKASEFAKDTSVSVSVFTLTALSFDRYNVIVNPVQSYVAGPKSKRRIIFTLAVIWLVSLGLASPAAVFSRLVEVKLLQTWNSSTVVVYDGYNDDQLLDQTQNDNVTSAQLLVRFCYPFPGKFGVDIHSKSVIVGRVLIQYLIPLAIIGTFYTITARHLLRSTGNIDGQATVTAASSRPNRQHPPSATSPTNNSNSNQESRRKVARMVQSLVALFLICFLPIHIYFLWFYFNPDSQKDYNDFWHALKIVGFVLAYTNSCINPVALYFISTNFRKHFDRLLFCCCRLDEGRSINVRSKDKSARPRRRDDRRRDGGDPLQEFQQRGSNPLTSLEQTPSDKRTTSSQNGSDVPLTAVSSVHDETSGNNKPLPVTSSSATNNKENLDVIDPALSIA